MAVWSVTKRRFGRLAVGLVGMVAWAACVSTGSSPPPDGSGILPTVPVGGNLSGHAMFEGVVFWEGKDITGWVRLCSVFQEPIPNAQVAVNQVVWPYEGLRPMVFYDNRCANYQGPVAEAGSFVFELRWSGGQVQGTVPAPSFQAVQFTDLISGATVPRNQAFQVRWTYGDGRRPPYIYVAILAEDGRRLYAGLTQGDRTSFTVPQEEMLSLPPGAHWLWVIALDGFQVDTAVRDGRTGLGSGLWVGRRTAIRLFFI
jgi:hypothetical protein